jgi:hypothetical protein
MKRSKSFHDYHLLQLKGCIKMLSYGEYVSRFFGSTKQKRILVLRNYLRYRN